jgi:hypothetical protein
MSATAASRAVRSWAVDPAVTVSHKSDLGIKQKRLFNQLAEEAFRSP